MKYLDIELKRTLKISRIDGLEANIVIVLDSLVKKH